MIRALALVIAAVGTAGATGPAPTEFTLKTTCPPGFEKTDVGVCELRTLYQFYDSLENRGVGGTRTSRPTGSNADD
jgi:cytochrome c peroxidase